MSSRWLCGIAAGFLGTVVLSGFMILKQKLNLHPEVDPLNDWLVVLSMVAGAGNRPFKRTRSLNVRPFRSGDVDFADQHDAGARSRRRPQYGPDSMSRGNNAETGDPSGP